jgi:hypothetical protein
MFPFCVGQARAVAASARSWFLVPGRLSDTVAGTSSWLASHTRPASAAAACVIDIFLYQVTVTVVTKRNTALASDRRLLVVMVCGCQDKLTGTRLC